jgi:4,5-DOPA dioxygenase extradiol
MARLGPIFISHGSPMLALNKTPAHEFLASLGAQLPRPKSILCVSAHWETPKPMASTAARPETIHDFSGFPEPLYRLRYPAPGAPELAQRAIGLLREAGIDAAADQERGLDHGAWVPLMLMYPQADIPVVQLSVQSGKGAGHHIALGRKLAPLRGEDVLVLGSGGFVHNLGKIAPPGSPEPDWSKEFSGWMHERLTAQDDAALGDYRARAPHAALAHPSEEHLMPLLVAYGAGAKPERLHSSATFGSLRMDAYSFG